MGKILIVTNKKEDVLRPGITIGITLGIFDPQVPGLQEIVET